MKEVTFTKVKSKKIVVFAPRFIGDAVNTSYALQILLAAYPDATVTLLAREPFGAIAPRLGCSGFIVDPRKTLGLFVGIKSLIRDLKAGQFDIAVLFTNTFADAAIARMAGIPVRAGYATEARGPLLTHPLKHNPHRHYINRYAYIANALCETPLELLPDSGLKTEPFSLPASPKTVTLAVYFGCEIKGPRYYPMADTAELLKRLAKHHSVRFVAIGANFEFDSAEQLSLSLGDAVAFDNLCGKTSLVQMIDVIAACDGLITIDSAPLHIASALKKPLVVLESQGFSAFSSIQPKSPYAWVASSRWRYIKDEDQVKDIPIERIESAVAKMIAHLCSPQNSAEP